MSGKKSGRLKRNRNFSGRLFGWNFLKLVI
jgi:hypothetical protein